MSIVKKIFKTTDVPPLEQVDFSGRSPAFSITTGHPKLTDSEYIARFGTAEELSGLRRLVEERLGRRPQVTYWICPKCHWQSVAGPDVDAGRPCIKCNMQGFKGGGFLRAMTKKEAEKYRAATAAAGAGQTERMKRMAFAADNESRVVKQGLEPLTRAAWDKNRKAAWQRQRAAEKQTERNLRAAAQAQKGA